MMRLSSQALCVQQCRAQVVGNSGFRRGLETPPKREDPSGQQKRRLYLYKYTYAHACMYVFLYIYTCTYIHIYMYRYAHKSIYIHIYISLSLSLSRSLSLSVYMPSLLMFHYHLWSSTWLTLTVHGMGLKWCWSALGLATYGLETIELSMILTTAHIHASQHSGIRGLDPPHRQHWNRAGADISFSNKSCRDCDKVIARSCPRCISGQASRCRCHRPRFVALGLQRPRKKSSPLHMNTLHVTAPGNPQSCKILSIGAFCMSTSQVLISITSWGLSFMDSPGSSVELRICFQGSLLWPRRPSQTPDTFKSNWTYHRLLQVRSLKLRLGSRCC